MLRLLEAGGGGFQGGLTAEKYCKLTGVPKATATRDLANLLSHDLLRVDGAGYAYLKTVPARPYGQR